MICYMPSSVKKHCKKYQIRKTPDGHFVFLSFFFFIFLRWSSSKLKNHGFISNTFSKLVRMRTNHLVTKQLLFKIAEKYGCVHEDRESLWHPLLTQCLNRAWSIILQPILHTSLRKPIWGQTCCSVIDGKFQCKHQGRRSRYGRYGRSRTTFSG